MSDTQLTSPAPETSVLAISHRRNVRGRARKLLTVEIVFPIVVVLGVWGFTLSTSSYFYPPLGEVFNKLFTVWMPRAVSDILPSLVRMGIGFAAAIVIGIVLGMLLGQSWKVRALLQPTFEFLRAIPATALIPSFILLFGIDDAAKIYLIAFVCIWPILLNTIDGVGGIEPTLRETADVYQISRRRLQFRIILPAATPQIMAGLRIALALSLIMMVVSEMVGSTNGIGYFVLQAQRTFAIPEMWAGIIILGVFGYLLNLVFMLIERKVLAWHRGAMSARD